MTWSYGDPSSNEKDAVRFEIGDTDSTDPLLQDAEISYAISVTSNILGAAARCCDALARKFARQADVRLGPQSIAASQRSRAFMELARDLRSRLAGAHPPYSGGLSKSEAIQDELDIDLKKPIFKRDLMSNNSSVNNLIGKGR